MSSVKASAQASGTSVSDRNSEEIFGESTLQHRGPKLQPCCTLRADGMASVVQPFTANDSSVLQAHNSYSRYCTVRIDGDYRMRHQKFAETKHESTTCTKITRGPKPMKTSALFAVLLCISSGTFMLKGGGVAKHTYVCTILLRLVPCRETRNGNC